MRILDGLGQAKVVGRGMPRDQYTHKSVRGKPYPSEDELIEKGLIRETEPWWSVRPYANLRAIPIPRSGTPVLDFEMQEAREGQERKLFPYPRTREQGFTGVGMEPVMGVEPYILTGIVGAGLVVAGAVVKSGIARAILLSIGGSVVASSLVVAIAGRSEK